MNEHHRNWAMAEDYIRPTLQNLAGIDMVAPRFFAREPVGNEVASWYMGEGRYLQYDVEGDTAKVDIIGPVIESVPWIYHAFGMRVTALDELQSVLEEIAGRDDIENVTLRINSPGGTVSGTQEVANAVQQVKASGKKVTAKISGMAASAAYWIAAQADEIVATPLSQVGSIGVYNAIYDLSKMVEEEGIEVILVKSGGIKGDWTPGLEPSEEYIADLQRTVDDINTEFVKAVSAGRGMPTDDVQKLNTGQTWLAKQAKAKGLVDTVANIPATDIARLETIDPPDVPAEPEEKPAAATANNQGDTPMDAEQVLALQKENPDHAALIIECHEKGMSETQTRDAIAEANQAEIGGKLEAMTERAEKAEAELAEVKAENEELQAKVERAKEWGASGASVTDAGSDEGAADDGTATDDASLKSRWEGMTQAQRNEFGDDFDGFCFCMRNPQAVGLDR